MVRTHKGLGNANGNQQLEPQVIECAPKEVPVAEPVTMATLRALLVEQKEEMGQLICENGREHTTPVEQADLNIEQFEEGNYTRIVSQVELQVVRRINPKGGNEGNDGHGCKYKDFIVAKPPNLCENPTHVQFMNWISKMEMVFDSCECNIKQKRIFAVQ